MLNTSYKNTIMKPKMTNRERMLATFKHQDTDYIPLQIEIHPSYVVHKDVAIWKDQFERTDFLLSLGVDTAIEIWLPDPSFHPDVRVREWKETRPGEPYHLLCKEYDTPAGKIRHVIRETEDLYQWHKINRNTVGNIADYIDGLGLIEDVNPSRCIEFPISGPECLEKMKYLFQPITGEKYKTWKENALYAKRQAENKKVILIARRVYAGSAILWLTNAIETCIKMVEEPEFVENFLKIIQDWQTKNIEMVLDIGVDVVTRFGYYDIPDFWGVKYFEKFLAPLMNKEAELCHQAGARLSQQQSEGLTQLVNVYKKINVDILRDIDPIQGHEDLALIKKELGDEKTLWGGMNLLELEGNKKLNVEGMVRKAIEDLSPGGGFVLYPIPGVYADSKWEYVLRMIDAWKKYR